MTTPENPLSCLIAGMPEGRPRLENYVTHWAEVAPYEIATISEAGALTYAALAEHVTLAVANLQRDGVVAGDVVAVLAPPSNDFLVSFLAAVSLGATWLGLNPKYTPREIEHVVGDAKPRLLLVRTRVGGRDFVNETDALTELAARTDARLRWLEPHVGSPVSGYLVQRTDSQIGNGQSTAVKAKSDVAALVYTSGSTGAPKAALLSHRALIRAALVRSTVWKVSPLRLINNVPINHVGGLGDLACTALVAGGSQVFLETFSAEATLAAIDQHRVTYWYQAPTMFEMCFSKAEVSDVNWSSLQAAIWSGGRASPSLVARMGNVAHSIAVDYSMTESVGPIAMTPLCEPGLDISDTVGWPEPGRNLSVSPQDSVSGLAEVRHGEVLIDDQWMFEGYRTCGGVRAKGDWFRTGDLIEVGSDGSWRITGRTKDMFKSGGYNIYPREIEIILERHPSVETAIVVPAPDPLYLEIGVAFVKLRDGATVAQLTDYCRSQLANYKIPKRIHFLNEMPMLAIGKVDRSRLTSVARDLLDG